MPRLTTAQHQLLREAAASNDGVLQAPTVAPATISSLIKKGLLISVPKPGAPSDLLITEAGRAILHLDGSPAEAAIPPAGQHRANGKLGLMLKLIGRGEGATLEELVDATGWQPHSVRGAISGAIKKQLGLVVASERSERGRLYRLVSEATQ